MGISLRARGHMGHFRCPGDPLRYQETTFRARVLHCLLCLVWLRIEFPDGLRGSTTSLESTARWPIVVVVIVVIVAKIITITTAVINIPITINDRLGISWRATLPTRTTGSTSTTGWGSRSMINMQIFSLSTPMNLTGRKHSHLDICSLLLAKIFDQRIILTFSVWFSSTQHFTPRDVYCCWQSTI